MKIKKYFRINRIIRDISGHYIIAGYKQEFANMRQLLKEDMKKNKWSCNCIRCREIKDNNINHNNSSLEIITYNASGAIEYFISFINDNYLIGFLRLRIPNKNNSNHSTIIPILENCALIRELHVYSTLSTVGANSDNSHQHKGYGKKLIAKAEEISLNHNYNKIAIIAGTGVRDYYRKLGYSLQETYMCKNLESH